MDALKYFLIAVEAFWAAYDFCQFAKEENFSIGFWGLVDFIVRCGVLYFLLTYPKLY